MVYLEISGTILSGLYFNKYSSIAFIDGEEDRFYESYRILITVLFIS